MLVGVQGGALGFGGLGAGAAESEVALSKERDYSSEAVNENLRNGGKDVEAVDEEFGEPVIKEEADESGEEVTPELGAGVEGRRAERNRALEPKTSGEVDGKRDTEGRDVGRNGVRTE